MSDNTNNEEPNAIEFQTVEVAGARDWFMQNIIETVINNGVEIGVLLTIGGSIVSGVLISGRTYFTELGETLKSASNSEGDLQSVLGDAWKRFTEIYDKPEEESDDWSPPSAGFIHLRDARFCAPGQNSPLPRDKGMLWRGKISAIDGFSIGNLSFD